MTLDNLGCMTILGLCAIMFFAMQVQEKDVVVPVVVAWLSACVLMFAILAIRQIARGEGDE